MTDNSAQIWRNARLAARADPADVLENAVIVVCDGRIEWFGVKLTYLPRLPKPQATIWKGGS
ncbi:MAG: hypothetical protein CBARDMAM_5647 [uncultured Caballeronia sp.]|nr:MAG: hypothetical protein CBARDMAM_5647 [uncultured Caballeronia sp.]